MRRSLYILLFSITFIACSSSSRYRKQLDTVEAIIEEVPDSAKTILEGIPISLLSEGEEKALYNMLWTMTNYKLYNSFVDDSLISNYSAPLLKISR